MEVILLMEMFFLCGIAIGFLIGYPLGLFIDQIDKRIKNNGR
jgi:NhaP-type Na+/H+ or K+/H+ antiporter